MEKNLENFKNYCERYQNVFAKGDYSEEHSHLVEKILKNPILIGLMRVQSKYKEVGYCGENENGCIDLVFITDEEILYICEVKASSKRGRGIGTQLEKDYAWVRDNFMITPTRIGIQLTETRKIRTRIIPAEIEDILKLNLNKEGACGNESRIF
jgi:hypothetical protein